MPQTVPLEFTTIHSTMTLQDLELLPNYERSHYRSIHDLPKPLSLFIECVSEYRNYYLVTLADILYTLQDAEVVKVFGENGVKAVEDACVACRFGSVSYPYR